MADFVKLSERQYVKFGGLDGLYFGAQLLADRTILLFARWDSCDFNDAYLIVAVAAFGMMVEEFGSVLRKCLLLCLCPMKTHVIGCMMCVHYSKQSLSNLQLRTKKFESIFPLWSSHTIGEWKELYFRAVIACSGLTDKFLKGVNF